MHPTDHMSTENRNEMEVNKQTGAQQQINERRIWPHVAQELPYGGVPLTHAWAVAAQQVQERSTQTAFLTPIW